MSFRNLAFSRSIRGTWASQIVRALARGVVEEGVLMVLIEVTIIGVERPRRRGGDGDGRVD